MKSNINKIKEALTNASCGEAVIIIIILLAIAFGLLCLDGWVVMLLWNAIIPNIIHVSTITFWQSVGLNILLYLIIPHNSLGGD